MLFFIEFWKWVLIAIGQLLMLYKQTSDQNAGRECVNSKVSRSF